MLHCKQLPAYQQISLNAVGVNTEYYHEMNLEEFPDLSLIFVAHKSSNTLASLLILAGTLPS